jgi:hypothetical protein
MATNVAAVWASSTQAVVSWTISAPNRYYGIQYQQSDVENPADWGTTWLGIQPSPTTYVMPDPTWLDLVTFQTPVNTVNSLTPGKYYRFRILDGNRQEPSPLTYALLPIGGTSSASNTVAIGAKPGAPTLASVTFSSSTVTVDWNAPASIGDFPLSKYTVQYSNNGGSSWTTAGLVAPGVTSFDVEGLTLGQAYLFRVSASNAAGDSTYVTSSSVTPLAAPGQPTGLSFIIVNNGVYASWTAPVSDGGTPITDYIVEYSSNSGVSWTTFSEPVSTATELLVSPLLNNVGYVFRISAVNAFGTGLPSAQSSTVTPCPDVAFLINYVRQLTGVFSTDILSDDLLLFWINEAYAELGRTYQWPWLPVVTLSPIDRPNFDCDFHTILSYRVASRVLDLEADESNRSAAYTREYETMLSNLYNHYLRAQDVGAPASMADLVLLVRTLLNEYSQVIDDVFIQNRILNTHEELAASESWVFPSATFPYMGWDQARVLAYGAAARVAPLAGKDQAFTNVLLEEYMSGVAHIRILFQNNFSSRSNTAEALARQARDFLGNYSTKASASLLKIWIYEEYQNLCSERSWAWLERTNEFTIAAGDTDFSLETDLVKIYELHRVVTRTQQATTGVVDTEPVVLVPSTLDVRQNDPRLYYAVDHANGKVVIGPVQTEDVVLRIRYAVTPEYGYLMPATVAGATGNTFSEFAIPNRYLHILSYRVAMRAAVISEAPQDVYNMCSKAAQDLYDSMYRDYETAHSQEPFQMGGNALETRKYVPWFRTA